MRRYQVRATHAGPAAHLHRRYGGAPMNAYYNSLVVEGFTLNPQTWTYERKAAGK